MIERYKTRLPQVQQPKRAERELRKHLRDTITVGEYASICRALIDIALDPTARNKDRIDACALIISRIEGAVSIVIVEPAPEPNPSREILNALWEKYEVKQIEEKEVKADRPKIKELVMEPALPKETLNDLWNEQRTRLEYEIC